MPIILEDVEYLASLAQLELSQKEKVRFQQELNNIIKYIDQLNELNSEDVPATRHVIPMQNIVREDENSPSLSLDEALSNAPQKKDGFFTVPQVME